MANRHSDKKLRAEIRARMSTTGECYQQARARILARARTVTATKTDLVPFSYFGIPGTLATIESMGVAMMAFVPSSTSWSRGAANPFPLPILRWLSRTEA